MLNVQNMKDVIIFIVKALKQYLQYMRNKQEKQVGNDRPVGKKAILKFYCKFIDNWLRDARFNDRLIKDVENKCRCKIRQT